MEGKTLDTIVKKKKKNVRCSRFNQRVNIIETLRRRFSSNNYYLPSSSPLILRVILSKRINELFVVSIYEFNFDTLLFQC